MAEITTIGDATLNITFGADGLLSQISVWPANSFRILRCIKEQQEITENEVTGAYIFRPDDKKPITILGADVELEVLRGTQVDEVHQVFNNYVSQVVRIYKTEKVVEFEWLVGPILVDDDVGKEIARGKHWLIFGRKVNTSPTLKGRERILQNEVLMSNWLFFNDLSSLSAADWATKYTNEVDMKFFRFIRASYFVIFSIPQLARHFHRTFTLWH